MDLQAEIESMKSEMAFFQPGAKLVEPGSNEGLPAVPEQLRLTGHRDTITCVTFHPVYSTVASSSEDGSIRLWDYESG
jgi:platelet-activating factor acetylhydrolase IB subunit alpha